MAEDTLDSDFFQKLFGVVRDLLEPATGIFTDPAAKAELFGTLGLDPSTDVGTLPTTTNLDRYIAARADELDAFMLAGAVSDLLQVTLAIEGAIRAGIDADEDNPGLALDEILNAFLNVLAMDYVRRRSPTIHAAARLLATVTAETAALGGNVGLVEMIVDFLGRVFSEPTDEEEVQSLSQAVFIGLGVVLALIDRLGLEKNGIDSVDLRLGYGYEGIGPDSTTPVADGITDRTVTYSLTASPVDDPDNQGSAFTTLTWVPVSHGGVALVADLSGEVDITLPVSDDISFTIDLGGDGIFRVGEGASAAPGPNNRIKVTFKHKVDAPASVTIFPEPKIKVGLEKYSLSVTLTEDDFDIAFSGRIPFLLTRDEDAGFPQNLLPEKIDEKIPLDVGYSIQRSFYVGNGGGSVGSTTSGDNVPVADAVPPEDEPSFVEKILATIINKIDIRAPIHKDIGGVAVLQMLNIRTGTTGGFEAITFETSIDFAVKMGSVLTISISRLGAEMRLVERDDNGGLFGRDLEVALKPPTGAGIVVDAEVVRGGGFLSFDPDHGEYFGALELEFKEVVALKAVGIINTVMPNGEPGFSMLILITAEFSPVSLAFGFTLDGVGGLLGVDRSVEVETLRAGVRTNAIRSILFPEDVVGNISRIVSDIRTFFPIKEGQFVVGLMAQIGYAGTDLVTIELGVIVELPDPKVLILGVVRVAAPDTDRDALKLQVNFLGLIDFANEFAYFEAHLFDSHVVGFPLTGSLALVVGWGGNGLFAVSVGGFHPDFKDYPSVPTLPGAFRDMSRVGFSLLGGDNPSLTVECYFALTSNSLQFGAKLELLAEGPMGFNLYGLLAFDALFIFDPFSFVISLEATLAIRKGRKILFGISFRGELSGTSPWHIEGEVTFGLLFFDVTIGFSETWGEDLDEIAPAGVDLVGLVRAELREERNWRVSMGRALHHTVTHRQLEDLPDGVIVVYPFGELSFSQRTVPLDYEIEKYGTQRPEGATRISVREVAVGDRVLVGPPSVRELFAAGQYTRLSEQEKLSRTSFEKLVSGFAVEDSGTLATVAPDHAPVDLDYELNYTDDDEPRLEVFGIALQAFDRMHRQAAVARSELGWMRSRGRVLNHVEELAVTPEGYAIARTDDLREVDASLRSPTLTEATAHLEAMVAADPSLADSLQVVQSHELVEV